MTLSSGEAAKLATEAIDLFLEYREKHGYTEQNARGQVAMEFADAYSFDPTDGGPTSEVRLLDACRKARILLDGVGHKSKKEAIAVDKIDTLLREAIAKAEAHVPCPSAPNSRSAQDVPKDTSK